MELALTGAPCLGLIPNKALAVYSNQIIYKDSFYCQSIVSAIRVIYTKSGEFYYRYLHRFSTISLIIGISGLSFLTACSNSYTKSISITYKNFYKQTLYFGLPGVCGASSVKSTGKIRRPSSFNIT